MHDILCIHAVDVKCVASELLRPIARKWREFGKYLGIVQRRLDTISSKHIDDQTRLSEVIHFYFTIKATDAQPWERIAKALWIIREDDLADNIKKTCNLDKGLV